MPTHHHPQIATISVAGFSIPAISETFSIPSTVLELQRTPPESGAQRAAFAYAFTEARQGRQWDPYPGGPLPYSEFAHIGFPRMTSIPSVRNWRNRWLRCVQLGLLPEVARGDTITVEGPALRHFYDRPKGRNPPGKKALLTSTNPRI